MKVGVTKILKEAVYPFAVVAFLFFVWFVAAVISQSEFIVPRPLTAIKLFFVMLTEAKTYGALLSTLTRSVISYLISFGFALSLAVISLFFAPAYKLLSPVVSVLRALPTMAVVLLLIIWTGPKTATVIVALLVIFPTLYSLFYESMTRVDRDVIDMAKIDGADKTILAFRFYIPLAAPMASRSAAGALSLCVKLTVAAEVLASTAGSLGAMMQTYRVYFETARLMALTTMTVIVSLLLEAILYRLLRLSFKNWI